MIRNPPRTTSKVPETGPAIGSSTTSNAVGEPLFFLVAELPETRFRLANANLFRSAYVRYGQRPSPVLRSWRSSDDP